MDPGRGPRLRYAAALPAGVPLAHLVLDSGTADEERVPVSGMLEIGRDEEGREPLPGLLLLADPAVSRRHCLIVQSGDGRWYVRDVSRNGTRVAGRRLVPNVETELRPGETLTVGGQHFTFDIKEPAGEPVQREYDRETDARPARTMATVLVGDIRDYTVLVRCVSSTRLQRSVSRVFEILTSAIIARGGTIKEYPGDAVMAFWEGGPDGGQAALACRAALELDRLAQGIAADSTIWEIDFPLRLDWALATGAILIHSFGGDHPQGLSLIGEPVVLAFRLEKLAGDDTGSILTCARTRDLAGTGFGFRDLGEIAPKGFEQAGHVYVLETGLDQVAATAAARPEGR